jgi:hypothetical protein
MVRVDDLAVLPAQIAEAPIVRDHGEIAGFLGHLLVGHRTARRPLDQLPQRHHVAPQVIMDHAQMLPRLALLFGQTLELWRWRTRCVVKKLDIIKHAS